MCADTTDPNNRVVASNRRARHDYLIEDTFEAGIVLRGSEVKSMRAGAVTIGDGYVTDIAGELYLVNVHIHEYAQANRYQHDPTAKRKLLLHRREITEIIKALNEKGRSCVPLRFYLKRGIIKVELGIGRGKKHWDRRQDIKARDDKREMARARKAGRDEAE